MNGATSTFFFTLPAVAAALIGGSIAAWRPPGEKVTGMVQHLAAGIVFAATALELLPKERTAAAVPVILGFALGLALMLIVRQLAGAIEKREAARSYPFGLLVVTAIDLVIDGVVLGIAFASGEKTGLLLAIALTLEVLFLALSVAVTLVAAKTGRMHAALVPAGLALILSASAVVGRVLFGQLPAFAFTVLLGVGTVALLYLVTEELLVEAHEVKETPWAIGAFFVGFLAFLLLEMLIEQ